MNGALSSCIGYGCMLNGVLFVIGAVTTACNGGQH